MKEKENDTGLKNESKPKTKKNKVCHCKHIWLNRVATWKIQDWLVLTVDNVNPLVHVNAVLDTLGRHVANVNNFKKLFL